MGEEHREWGKKGGKARQRSGLKRDLTWAYRHLGDAKLSDSGEVVLSEGMEPPSKTALVHLKKGLEDPNYLTGLVLKLEQKRNERERDAGPAASRSHREADPDDERCIKVAEGFIRQAAWETLGVAAEGSHRLKETRLTLDEAHDCLVSHKLRLAGLPADARLVGVNVDHGAGGYGDGGSRSMHRVRVFFHSGTYEEVPFARDVPLFEAHLEVVKPAAERRSGGR